MTYHFQEPTPLNIEPILDILRPGGLLSLRLKGYEERKQQQEMLCNIIDAYHNNQVALIEAGTGTGKSLAYLIPAILWAAQNQERTVISTNTIALQEQLVNKDIPFALKLLDVNVKVTLVKGMGNYICLRKMADSIQEISIFDERDSQEIQRIDGLRKRLNEGCRSELPFSPNQAIWERVSAESDTCSGTQCPHFANCYFFKARKTAQDAHILIVNHHMLFADLALRAETGNFNTPAILPPYERLIIDEAHHIEEVATEYFAQEVSRLSLIEVLNKLSPEKSLRMQGRLAALRSKIEELINKDPDQFYAEILQKISIDLSGYRRDILHCSDALFEDVLSFSAFLQIKDRRQDTEESSDGTWRILPDHLKHPHWQQEILPCADRLLSACHRFIQSTQSLDQDLQTADNPKIIEETKNIRLDIKGQLQKLNQLCLNLESFIQPGNFKNSVKWIEHSGDALNNIRIKQAQFDISSLLRDNLFNKMATIVLCSATLSTNKRFEYFRSRVGLTESFAKQVPVTENCYDSPFDYSKQALLAVPIDMPAPQHPDFLSNAIQCIIETIEGCRGNAFILFTSYSMLQAVYMHILPMLQEKGFHLMKQGDENRHALLKKFIEKDRSVLFGTDSFWEGVDVIGDALRCVIIVKLPFQVPSEPIIQARAEAIVSNGGSPFMDYAIPNAIVKFKQGFGRLIRHKEDRGSVVCLDSRIATKPYGRFFLNSLPECAKAFVPQSELKQALKQFYWAKSKMDERQKEDISHNLEKEKDWSVTGSNR